MSVGGRIVVGTPKTHERRSVPYPAFLSEMSRAACAGKTPHQLVFGDGIVHKVAPKSGVGWFCRLSSWPDWKIRHSRK